MLDRLFDFLLQFLGLFRFWAVIDSFDQGVLLRFGRVRRTLEPGFHWVWPLAIDEVLRDCVEPRSVRLPEQSLTTQDGVSVVLTAVVDWQIEDIRPALTRVENLDASVESAVAGMIGDQVAATDWEQMQGDEFFEGLAKAARTRTTPWGVWVIRVQLADLTVARSMRLWMPVA